MNRLRGFTLTELLITIVIAAMIVSAAIPALISSTQNNRLTAYSNELITALNIARIKAIETGRAVSVCPSSNGIACAGSSDWSNGWIVFLDASGANGILDNSDKVVRRWEALDGNASVTGETNENFVRFVGTGAAAQSATLTLSIPDCTGDQGRRIDVDSTGRASVSKLAC